jgi:hypothetical protein
LAEKLGKLSTFLADDSRVSLLTIKAAALLFAQQYAMSNYLDILSRRIDALNPNQELETNARRS